MRIGSVFVLALGATLAVEPAFAAFTCRGGSQSEWKSVDQVTAEARDLGYTNIVKVILEDGCYEVVILNDQGQIVGVQFDPVTLEIEKIEDPP